MFDENQLYLDQDPTPAPSLLPPRIKKRPTQRPRDFETIKILSQNVNGLKATEKLEILSRHITINSIPAMCLQETWLEKKSQTDIPTVNNKSCMFFHYGPDSQNRRGSGGVGFLLNHDGIKAWKRAGSHPPDYLSPTNETCRAMGIKLCFTDNKRNKIHYYLITAYYPDSSKSQDEFDLFLTQYSDFLDQIPPKFTIVSGEDCNSTLGCRTRNDTESTSNYRHIGPHALTPSPNTRGTQVLNLLSRHLLSTTSSWFQKKHYDTHHCHLNKQNIQIDHIMTSQKNLKSTLDSHRVKSVIPSDHLPIQAKFLLAKHIPKKKSHHNTTTAPKKTNHTPEVEKNPIHLDYNLLKNPTTLFKFKRDIIKSINEDDNLATFTSKIKDIELQHLNRKNKPDKPWFTHSTDSLTPILHIRDRAQIQFHNHPSETTQKHLRTIRSIFKKAITKAKNKWIQFKSEQIMSISADPVKCWEAVKDLERGLQSHHKASRVIKMRKPDGTLCTNDNENAKVFYEHFSKIFNNQNIRCDESVLTLLPQRDEITSLNDPPTLEEVKNSIKRMRNRKAPGPSGLKPDVLKALTQETFYESIEIDPNKDKYLSYCFANSIHKYLLEFWNGNNETVFEEWRTGTLTPVPKKGDLSNPNKWRPVCLLEVTYKVLASIIATRMNPIVREFGLEEQCGSLNNKGCQDALMSLKTALQIRREHNMSTEVLFVDLVKAFDTINHEFLFKVLHKYGYPTHFINIIKRMYLDFELTFSVGKTKMKIPYTIGVHQGDNLAPILFNIFFQAAIDTLSSQWTTHQIQKPTFKWFPSERQGRLRNQNVTAIGQSFEMWKSLYVDDGAFLFTSRQELEKGGNIIYKHFLKFGLTMHIGKDGSYKDSKTEAVHFASPTEPQHNINTSPVKIDNGYITYTSNFTYLGSILSSDLDDSTDINNRIKQATRAFGAMSNGIFKNPFLSTHSKKLLYLAIPINLLLWGCETWAVKKSDWKKLQAFHTTCIRKILKISMWDVHDFHINNTQILNKFGIEPIQDIAYSRQLHWLGKITRMPNARMPRKMLTCWLNNKRRTGRPHITIRHTYLEALKRIEILNKDDKNGKISDWFPIAKDRTTWESTRKTLTQHSTSPYPIYCLQPRSL
mgnify:FL=1